MNRIVHFEIQADDIERAKEFYTNVFGWKIEKWEGEFDYWFILSDDDGKYPDGINGGLLKRPAPKPEGMLGANAFVCTMQVDDFDNLSEKILKAGGEITLAKYALPGMAWQGYFIDTEGNTFGLHQPDENAK